MIAPNTAMIGNVRTPAKMEPVSARLRSRSRPMRKPSIAASSSDQIAVRLPYSGNARSIGRPLYSCRPQPRYVQGGQSAAVSCVLMKVVSGFRYGACSRAGGKLQAQAGHQQPADPSELGLTAYGRMNTGGPE